MKAAGENKRLFCFGISAVIDVAPKPSAHDANLRMH
jgi:hypothetical protein